jgi:hypothetical protein
MLPACTVLFNAASASNLAGVRNYLVVENFLLAKTDQPEIEKDDSWKDEFALD